MTSTRSNVLTILDDRGLTCVTGGKLPDAGRPPEDQSGEQRYAPMTPAKRDERLCARHWLSTMGLGDDHPDYIAACRRMDQRRNGVRDLQPVDPPRRP